MKAIHFLCLVLLCVLPFFAGACTVPTATPVGADTPVPTDIPTPVPTDIPTAVPTDVPTAVPTDIPTPVPTDVPTAVPTDTPMPDIVLITPKAETVDTVLAGLGANQLSGNDHVGPPSASLDELAAIYAALTGQETLVNPCKESCAVFNLARATTYSLPAAGPQIGALYQLVSLQQPFDAELAESKAWGERGLVVGGLLVAQANPLTLPKTDRLPTGAYLVVLRRVGGELEAELWNDQEAKEPYTTVPWRLRQRQGLTQTAEIPFSFVSADELCFSQIEFQACLAARTPTVGSAQNFDAIANAIEKLKADNLLPEDAQVRTDAAMPDIQGRDTISKCQGMISEKQPQDCQANVMAAGMDALVEQADGFGGDFSELIAGVGVLAVLSDIPDEIFDSAGKLAPLEAGSYRIDLIRVKESENRWLAQFVQAGSRKPFYLYAVEVYAQGVLVDPDPDADLKFNRLDSSEFSSEVLLGTYYCRICQRSLVTDIGCNNPNKWKRDWCITDGTPGWCDEVGY